MDLFGHVNHARVVTLLEEARVPLLFDEAARAGLTELTNGIVVVRLAVNYHAPIVLDNEDVRIVISLSELKFSSFTLDYKVHSGPSEKDVIAVSASTVLAPYDVARKRPRRLNDAERDFLLSRLEKSTSGGADA
jgi:acyl-CoA thioester hydrolase